MNKTITATFVFVSSADLGCCLWIKQAAKLQCSKKVMYSHILTRFVVGTSGDHIVFDINFNLTFSFSFFMRGKQGTILNTNTWGQNIPYKYPTQTFYELKNINELKYLMICAKTKN